MQGKEPRIKTWSIPYLHQLKSQQTLYKRFPCFLEKKGAVSSQWSRGCAASRIHSHTVCIHPKVLAQLARSGVGVDVLLVRMAKLQGHLILHFLGAREQHHHEHNLQDGSSEREQWLKFQTGTPITSHSWPGTLRILFLHTFQNSFTPTNPLELFGPAMKNCWKSAKLTSNLLETDLSTFKQLKFGTLFLQTSAALHLSPH